MWQPTADLVVLQRRAKLLGDCRSFFAQRKVLEVEVPVLGQYGVSDPNIECLCADDRVLQSSPEYYLKRLLAAGSGDVYYLGKAFRREESGRRHSQEFTLLEWYRCGLDEFRLAAEVVDLLGHVSADSVHAEKHRYEDLFLAATGLNPHTASVRELAAYAHAQFDIGFDLPDKSAWLDLLFSHAVEPVLANKPRENLQLVFDFPACQAALARIRDAGNYRVARRFEVFWRGLELANGYFELCDAGEQKTRFEADLRARMAAGKPLPEIDPQFLQALEAGLPACAGVALGIDRLLMCLTGLGDIKAVQAFGPMG